MRLAFVAGSAATLAAGVTVGALGQLAWQQAAPTPARLALRSGVPVVLSRPELRHTCLRPQDLPGVTLTDCCLIEDWRGRDLKGAYFWECDLRGAQPPADLSGCYYDRFTCWPAGFDPRRAGAKLVGRHGSMEG